MLLIWIKTGKFRFLLFVKHACAFPLQHFYHIWGHLVQRLEKQCPEKQTRWLGFWVKAIDTMTLALPEWPDLFKKFKCHKTGKGLGTIAVECCCLFCVGFRAPIAYAFGQANLSDHKLIRKLIKFLKKGDLLLIDGGFYSFRLFKALALICPFIIPMDKSGRPRVIKILAKGCRWHQKC